MLPPLMCAQAMLLSMVYKSLMACQVSKCFSASAKWLVLDDLVAQLHANILMTISLMLLFV